MQGSLLLSSKPFISLLEYPRLDMGEGFQQMFRGISAHRDEDDEELFDSASMSDESDDDTFSSSSDLTDDEASSSPKPYPPSSSTSSSMLSSQLDSKPPLYELSSLMAQLPIKRGLSKYYEGKSQSFTSLSNAICIEDLPKKETPFRRKMKGSKSYGGGLDASQKHCYAPGPSGKTISKKALRGGSCASLVARRSSSSLLCSSKPPPIPVHKNS